MYFILSLPRIIAVLSSVKAIPEIILRGVGCRHFFVLWGGGGCFVDNVSEGWGIYLTIRSSGGGLTYPRGQGIFDPWIVGRVLGVGDLVH